MADPAKKKATYEDLFGIPENMTGEIIDGELIVTPRPSRYHVHAGTVLGYELGPPYQLGRGGGPGGWVILDEPEIKLGENILVPDLGRMEKRTIPQGGGDQLDIYLSGLGLRGPLARHPAGG